MVDHQPDLDGIFGALSDPSRRHIVTRLAEHGTMAIGDAADGLDLSPAAISKHVRVLEDAGMVRREVVGRRHLLALEEQSMLLASDWIVRYRSMWKSSLQRLADAVRDIERGEN